MINPNNITDYGRSDYQLEEFLLFCIMVAGKRADITSRALDDFLAWVRPKDQLHMTPFTIIRNFMHADDRDARQAIAALEGAILAFNRLHPGSGIGQKGRMARAFWEAAQIEDLPTADLKRLMRVHGIGPKTARLFLLHSREGARFAVLDTHILKYLRQLEQGGIIETEWGIPGQTPTNPTVYAELEQIVLDLADERGMTPAQFDLAIWTEFAVGNQERQREYAP